VDGVSFSIPEATTVALVGESGSGKSVTALSLARLVPEPPGYYAGGKVLYRGQNVLEMSRRELQSLRGGEIAYVFQDPANALNPVFTIGFQIEECLRVHAHKGPAGRSATELLRLVGMPDPDRRLRAYAHELSGGMKQRAAMAIALACRPRLLVADEPTTALDVTVQAQLLERVRVLQEEMDMAVLLITHNLGLVAGLAAHVYIMYAGRIVESGPVERVLNDCAHPYTKALLNAVPRLNREGGRPERLDGIPGMVPHPADLPPGCKFSPRCSRAEVACRQDEPVDQGVAGSGATDDPESHRVRCLYPLNEKVSSP
jgi:oligopeptide/dipeptide ABC transporter ATP-binding protein